MRLTCNKHLFERRAKDRGYSWEDVAACIVIAHGDQITVNVDHPAYPRDPKGGATIVRRRGAANPAIAATPRPQAPAAPQALPRAEWPRLARWLAKLARPGELGLGDVVARYAGAVGGERFKKIYKKLTGAGCGCEARQDALNAMYPF